MTFSKRYNIDFPLGSLVGTVYIPLKEELTNSGLWTVVGSGSSNAGSFEFQGSTAGSGGGTSVWDVWVTEADASAVDAWCVLEDAEGRQLLLMAPPATSTTSVARILWDIEGNYSATGISATIPPAVTTKEQEIIGSRSTAGAFPGNTNRKFHIFVEDEQINTVCPFHMLTTVTGSGTRYGVFAQIACKDSADADLEPYVWVINSTNSCKGWEGIGTVSEIWRSSATLDSLSQHRYPFHRSANDPSKNYLQSVFLTSQLAATTSYPRGVLHGVLGRSSSNSNFHCPNYSQKDANGVTWIYWYDMAYWWSDEETPTPVTGGTPTERTSEFFQYTPGGGASDTTPPVISITTPAGNLGSRTASVTFDVTDDTALGPVTVLVNFPTLNVTECAYHNGSFRAPYLGSSLATNTFTLVRTGGWPADFNLDVSAVDAAGNVQG